MQGGDVVIYEEVDTKHHSVIQYHRGIALSLCFTSLIQSIMN